MRRSGQQEGGFAAVLVCALWISGCAGTSLVGSAPTLADAVLPVVSAQETIDRVWAGFWPSSRLFLIYEPEGDALLYSPSAPPAPYRPCQLPTKSDVDDAHRINLYCHAGVPSGLHGLFDTAFRVGGATASAVVLEDSVERTLETLFHETFHVYQDAHFEGEEPGFEFLEAEGITPSIIAKAEIERRILRAALAALAEQGAPEKLIRQYLAVRASRMRQMPANARAIERITERTEGSAELVGIQATAAALGRTRGDVVSRIRGRLGISLDRFSGRLPERMFRWRLYETGAAIGLLLDRVADKEWREQLEKGATFEALLAETTGFDEVAGAESLAGQTLERFDYASLLQEIAARQIAEREPASFDAAARVDVAFSGLPGTLRSSFRGTFTALEEELVLIDARLYKAEVADFVLVARDMEILLDNREEPRLSFGVTALPVISGLSLENGAVTLDQLSIETGELTIKADRAVEVSMQPAQILIRILAR